MEVKLDGKLLESLRKVDEKKLTKNPHYQTTFDSATIIAPYAEEAEKLIALMGVSGNPDLVQMYRDFFDSQWVISPWYKDSRFDIRGLGSEAFETISVEGNEGLTSFQDVGFFYGFTQAGGERYMILQIVPGSTLTPESHPEAFIATNISGGYLGLRDIKEWGKAEEQYPVKLNKREPYARYWTAKELKDLFNLKRGTIVSTVGAGMNSGYYYAYYMYIQMNEFPGEEEQTGKYKLKGFGSW
ncbi:MAG: hypothetical protein Q8P91_00755 [bacterium]|nr:hypothetical protein [bacterium]